MPVILILPDVGGNGVIDAQAAANIPATLMTMLFAVHIHEELREEISKRRNKSRSVSLTPGSPLGAAWCLFPRRDAAKLDFPDEILTL